ncbi:MAG: zf-HC2 domain-containing protein [Ignavibacteriae bacterium]|nr:zf-HC2 domain-containing protein [Ignavibacteriota bacterium]
MKCSDVEILLPDYVVNKLSNGQYSGVQSHLENCPVCRSTANEFSYLLVGMKKFRPKEPSELYFSTILPRVHQRLEAKQKQFQIPEYLFRFIMPVAMTVVLVMFAVNYQPSPNVNIVKETEMQSLESVLSLEVDATTETITQDDRSVIAEILAEVTEDIPFTEDETESLLTSMDESDASQLFALLEQPAHSEQR